MNRTPYTPGPWTNNPMQDTIWANDGEIKVATIADLPWKETASGRRCSDSETEQANARLIAAAPELLDSLLRISAVSKDGSLPPSQRLAIILDLADIRIAKAIGHELKAPAISGNLNQPL